MATPDTTVRLLTSFWYWRTRILNARQGAEAVAD
jgi:hypothetical protein